MRSNDSRTTRRMVISRYLFGTTLLCTLGSLPAAAQITQAEYAARRAALAAALPDGILVAIGARDPRRDYDIFSQTPNMWYLTGFLEPGASMIMTKRNGEVRVTLFAPPRDPASETWTGPRLGPEGLRALTGVPTLVNSKLVPTIDSLVEAWNVDTLLLIGQTGSPSNRSEDERMIVSGLRRSTIAFADANRHVSALRAVKSPAELALLRESVRITGDGMLAAWKILAPGRREYHLRAELERAFVAQGALRPSFATNVSAGANATVLHHRADTATFRDGDLALLDIGASYQGYAADVTRTVPANGRFTSAQREIYQAVRNAQAAAEKAATLGAPSRNMSDSATAVLGRELTALGLIEAPKATYACRSGDRVSQCSQLGLFYMHGLGHGIGLLVHDPGPSSTLKVGHAFSIEPGIYVRPNTLDLVDDIPENRAYREKLARALERYRNIGVRIEDDFLMTERGLEWISTVPREVDEIERTMRDQSATR